MQAGRGIRQAVQQGRLAAQQVVGLAIVAQSQAQPRDHAVELRARLWLLGQAAFAA